MAGSSTLPRRRLRTARAPESEPFCAATEGGTAIQKEEPIELDGQVTEVLGNANFRVEINENHSVLAKIAGKMRRFRIRVLEGDRVSIEVSPYDLNRGRITYRHKS